MAAAARYLFTKPSDHGAPFVKPLPPFVLLAPALLITLGLGGVALGLGLGRSFGLVPFGESRPGLAAWTALADHPGLLSSVVATLTVAVVSTLLAGILGLVAALALRAALGAGGRTRLSALLLQLNLAVPHVVVAAGLLFLLSQSGLAARLAYAAGLIAAPAEFPAVVADPWAIGVVTGLCDQGSAFRRRRRSGSVGRHR